MSLFCLNICQFPGCGLQYATLYELLAHIEDTHISKDPDLLRGQEESQPNALPLSYVLPLFPHPPTLTPTPINNHPTLPPPSNSQLNSSPNKTPRSRPPSHHPSPSPSLLKQELDEDPNFEESSNDGEDSNDSRPGVQRKFTCPQPGCNKKYKNMNGMRHHQRIAHANPGTQPRMHRCSQCGKEYKTSQGLQNHMNTHNPKPSPVPDVTPPSTPNASAATSAAALAGGHQYHQALSPSPFQHQYQRQPPKPSPTPPTKRPPSLSANYPGVSSQQSPQIHLPNPHSDHNF